MELKRRRLLAILAGGAVAVAAPWRWLAARLLPERVTRASTTARYPAEVTELDHDEVKRPGRWAG